MEAKPFQAPQRSVKKSKLIFIFSEMRKVGRVDIKSEI